QNLPDDIIREIGKTFVFMKNLTSVLAPTSEHIS
ncbi:MAG: hypothetical protein ACI9YB_002978, partial [Halioglobus sp.]